MFLSQYELLDYPCDPSATLPHDTGDLSLEVSAVAPHKVLERFIPATHSNDDLLTNDLAIHDFDTTEEVRGVNVLNREVMDLTQVLDSFQDLIFYLMSIGSSL